MVREPRLDELTDEDLHRIVSLYGAYSVQAEAARGELARRRRVCECVFSCADDPRTSCSLSGEFHVHPEWPCLIHLDAPGDRLASVVEE